MAGNTLFVDPPQEGADLLFKEPDLATNAVSKSEKENLAEGSTIIDKASEKSPEFQKSQEMYEAIIEREGAAALKTAKLNETTNQNVLMAEDAAQATLASSGTTTEITQDLQDLETYKQQQLELTNQTAFEEAKVNSLQDLALNDPKQAAMMAAHMDVGDTVQQVNDHLYKQEVWQGMIQELAVKAKDQAWYESTMDAITEIIPTSMASTAAGLLGEELDADMKMVGEKIFDTHTKFMNMSRYELESSRDLIMKKVEEDSVWLFGDNPGNARDALTRIQNMSKFNITTQNYWAVMETGIAAPTTTIGVAKNIITRVAQAGNRSAAAKIVANRITTTTEVITPNSKTTTVITKEVGDNIPDDEIIKVTSPQDTLDDYANASATLGDDVALELEVNAKVMDEVMALTSQGAGRLTEEEMNVARSVLVEEIMHELPNHTVSFSRLEGVKGLGEVLVHVGPKAGGGYASKARAQASAIRKGWTDAIIERPNPDGQWFISFKRNVKEAGAFKAVDTETIGAGGFWNRWIASGEAYLPKIFTAGTTKAAMEEGKIANAMRPLYKNIAGLSKKSKDTLAKVMEEGDAAKTAMPDGSIKEGKWFTPDEFVDEWAKWNGGKLPTNKEILSYYSIKNLNDLEWGIRNRELYVQRAANGYKTVGFRGKLGGEPINVNMVNGKVTQKATNVTDDIIYNSQDGTVHLEGTLSKEALQDIMDSGYSLVHLEEGIKIKGSSPAHKILVKNDALKSSGLNPIQMAYREGGHRMYTGKYTVKQANSFYNTTSKRTHYLNPSTHAVGDSLTDLKRWASEMDQVRLAYKTDKGGAEFMRLLTKYTEYTTKEAWELAIKKGKINPNAKFEVVFDGDMPQSMIDDLAKGAVDKTDEFAHSVTAASVSKGRMFYSKKGERLMTPEYIDQESAATMHLARVEDPFEMARRAIDNAINIGVHSSNQIANISRWHETFKRFLDLDSSVGKDPMRAFMEDAPLKVVGNSVDERALVAKAETMRATLKRNMNLDTKAGGERRAMLRRFSESVESAIGTSKVAKKLNIKAPEATVIFDKLDKNPISAMKGFAFDLKLGLFDPSQLLIQTQTMAVAVAIDPVNGLNAMRTFPWMRMALINRDSNFLSHVASNGLHGMDPAEFKTMIRVADEGGYSTVHKELTLADANSSVAFGTVANPIGRVREASRWTFYEAERLNRLVGFNIAWRKMKSQFPKMDVDSKAAREFLADETNRLTFNMIQSSAAWWQKGLMSVPTQFLSYQFKLMESMWSKQFTAMERARIGLSQFILYGAAGVPVVNHFTESYAKNNPGAIPTDAYKAWSTGMIDTILRVATDGQLDLAFSSRVGIGRGMEQWAKGLLIDDRGKLALGVKPASTGVLGDFVGTLYEASKVLALEDSGSLVTNEHLIVDILNNASSIKGFNKAREIWKYGLYLSRNGKSDIAATRMEALAAFFRIPLKKVQDSYLIKEGLRDVDKYIKDRSGTIAGIVRESIKNPEKAKELLDQAAGLIALEEDEYIKTRLLNAYRVQLPQDSYSRLLQNLEDRKK